MIISWIAGFIVGLLLVAIVSLVIRKVVISRGEKPREYDERQQVVRGKAFTVAYATIMLYLAAWLVMNTLELPFFGETTSLLIGILLSVGVCAGYSIFNDAYFRTSDRPRAWIVLIAVATAINLGIGIVKVARGSAGAWFGSANLLTGIMTGSILVCLLVKRIMDRCEGD